VSVDCVRYEKNKFFLNHHGWTLICKDVIIKKYVFYYLQSIQPELLSIAKGTAQLGINQENFYKLKIPVPSIERQKEIVEYCEYNDNLIKQLEQEIENNKKISHKFINYIIKPQLLEEETVINSVNNENIHDSQDETTENQKKTKVKNTKKPILIIENENENENENE
jgi:restriction endonuclease S subunit